MLFDDADDASSGGSFRRRTRLEVKERGRGFGRLRDRLRARCLQRVRDDRLRILKRSRERGVSSPTKTTKRALRDVIEEEIDVYKRAKRRRRRLRMGEGEEGEETETRRIYWDGDDSNDSTGGYFGSFSRDGDHSLPCEEEELILSLEKDLYDDLREQETAFLEELEDIERARREQIDADVHDFDAFELDEREISQEGCDVVVLCPICKKHYLRCRGSAILCRCGLRVDVEGDGLALTDLKRNLADIFEEHGQSGCGAVLRFNVTSKYGDGTTNESKIIVAKCGRCDYLRVAL